MRQVVLLIMVFIAVGAVAPSASAQQLVMIEEHGCYWCERWNEEVGVIYHKTSEGKRAPLRRIDMHDKLPNDLSFLAKGGYTPTFVLINEGREVGRIRGYPGEDFFWGLLGKLLDKLPPAAGLERNMIKTGISR